jgi:hypothetical protein
MGPDLLDGDVELTEFVAMDVQSIKGVRQGANGFPVLLMKGLGEPGAASKASDSSDAKDCPTCKGDGKIKGNTTDCPDCDGTGKMKAAKSVPAWHAAAKTLARMTLAAPSLPREALWKAIAADGSLDEQPDIDGGQQAIALIAKLITYEADELAAGRTGEVWDIRLLSDAVISLKCWLANEAAAQANAANGGCGCCSFCSGPACGCCPMCSVEFVMCSVAQDVTVKALLDDLVAKAKLSRAELNELPDSAFAYIEPGGDKDADGKTTPRSKRHFAIHDKKHADNAATRIAQGAKFGDEASPKVKAAQKRFGESDTSKGAVAEGETAVDTGTEDTGSLAKAVEDAVTKATAPLLERIETLGGEVAKVKALPVPGGPLLSTVRAHQRGAAGEDWTAKAAHYRQQADLHSDRETADGYRQLAREADEKAAKARTQAPAAAPAS